MLLLALVHLGFDVAYQLQQQLPNQSTPDIQYINSSLILFLLLNLFLPLPSEEIIPDPDPGAKNYN